VQTELFLIERKAPGKVLASTYLKKCNFSYIKDRKECINLKRDE
jgi:hypothetical protein